jgi:hypothetical protein
MDISCILCPVGTYADKDGSSSCNACPAGTTTFANGSYYEKQCITYQEKDAMMKIQDQGGMIPIQLIDYTHAMILST